MGRSLDAVMDRRTTRRSNALEPTIFHEPWWLNAAAENGFEEVEVFDNGKLVGRFPYVLQRLSFGRVVSRPPPFTHVLGPAVDEGDGTACNRILRRDNIIRELLSLLPRTTGFCHNMHSGISDLLVVHEQGFNASVRFTHTIAPDPIEKIWSNMRDKTRNVIRGAQKHLDVSEMKDVDRFIELYGKNISDAGYRNVFDTRSLSRLCAASIDRRRGKIIIASRGDGRIEAAIFYIWDDRNAYYLVTTRDVSAHNGAVSLLIWTAIEDCCDRGLVFDFDGVSTHGGRLFYTGFGGRGAPRYIASRYNRYQRVVDLGKRIIKPPLRTKYLAP